MNASSVAVPEIDQQTREALQPPCEAIQRDVQCDRNATHVAHWSGVCEDIGDHRRLYCDDHATAARRLKAKYETWACKRCGAVAELVSVLPL